MKRFLSILLSIILAFSIISIPAMANDMEVLVTGIKSEGEATFFVQAENSGASSEELNVYIAYTDKEGIVQKTEIYTFTVAAKSSVKKEYKADISLYTAKIFVWGEGVRPMSPSLTSSECGEKLTLAAENVWASMEPEPAYPAVNVVDGNLATKWTVENSSEESPDYAAVYLGGDYILSRVGIAFGAGSEREHLFSVAVSEDGENFTEVVAKDYSAKTNNMQYFEVSPVRARYVKYTFFGRKDNGTWTQVTEIEVYGRVDDTGAMLMSNAENEAWHINAMDEATYTDYTPALGDALYASNTENGLHLYDNVGRTKIEGEKLEIASVTPSQEPEANKGYYATNTLDGDSATIWTASGVTDTAPATLTARLDNEYYISRIGIGFDLGAERRYTFGIAVSDDGVNYTTLMGKTTAEKTNDIQYFNIGSQKAKYVQFIFYQRADSTAGWIRISEIEAYGLEAYDGAGAVMAQKQLTLPEGRGDFELSFDLEFTPDANTYYSGVSITSNTVTGGADLDDYAALQLRFANDGTKVKINRMISNYFNEGDPVGLFDSSFNRGEKIHFSIKASRNDRRYFITVSDSEASETQIVYFNYSDAELTRSSHWTWLDSNYLVFNTGAGASCEMTVSNINVRQIDRNNGELSGGAPANGIVRLEATRLDSYPTSSGDYYGRYVYHNGADEALAVAADKNPALTRFVERRGLLGCGVSLEAETLPNHFLVMEGDTIYLRKLENTGNFYARATFFKDEAENVGYYTGATYSYRTYIPRDKLDRFLYDTDNNHKSGKLGAYKRWNDAQSTFYVRSEVSPHVSDNFKGSAISSQWTIGYPWSGGADTHNHSGVVSKNNVIVENDELFLKATKGSVQDDSGEWGIWYGKWGKEWESYKGHVGVVSISNKVYNRQSYIEGCFKQPDIPEGQSGYAGFWNAFWLNAASGWPPEIDIFEYLSSVYGTKSWHTAVHGEGDSNNLFGKQPENIDLTKYHTFALDWGYDYMKFYVDGKLYERGHKHESINFQKNLELIINVGLGGWEAEPDSSTPWNDGMRCKYVRSFQYN